MACLGCDGNCTWLNANIPSNLHEIHITVDKAPSFELIWTYGFKLLTIDLKNGEQQLMLTKRMAGDEQYVLRVAQSRAKHIELTGIKVLRVKIETTPTNLPVVSKGLGYWEGHIKVTNVWDLLWHSLKAFEDNKVMFHLSANAVKPETYFLTARSKDMDFNWFKDRIQEKVCELKANKYEVADVIYEYCWYDSNEGLDSEWINQRLGA